MKFKKFCNNKFGIIDFISSINTRYKNVDNIIYKYCRFCEDVYDNKDVEYILTILKPKLFSMFSNFNISTYSWFDFIYCNIFLDPRKRWDG